MSLFNVDWKAVARGAKRSWTMIYAALLAALAALQSQIESLRRIFLEHTDVVLVGIAVLIAVLRARTTTSLTDKGKEDGQP